MATTRRKERRQQELVNAGRTVGRIVAERDSMAAARAGDAVVIEGLRAEKSQVSRDLGRFGNQVSELEKTKEAMSGELGVKNAEISELKEKVVADSVLLADQRYRIGGLEKELAVIRQQDRDSSKLRRRLREAKGRISELNTEVSRLKQQD